MTLATKKTTKKKTTAKAKTTKKAATKKVATKKKAAPKAKKAKSKRKPNAAFMKPLTPSATLAAVIGGSAVPRTEAVKRLWAYIKKHNLQDKKNKRMINSDDNLKKLFGAAQVSMFDIAKALKKHLS